LQIAAIFSASRAFVAVPMHMGEAIMTILAPWCMERTAHFKRHLGQTGRALLPTLALRKNPLRTGYRTSMSANARLAMVVLITLGSVYASPGVAQSQTGEAEATNPQVQGQQPRLTFDVAAIHPSKPAVSGGGIKPLPNGTGYIVQNMTVKSMMTVIYRIPPGRIQGGPDWFSTAAFDLEAKADRAYGLDDLHTMFKNLLADRFGLKFHTETKQGPVYELMVDRSGVTMKADGDVGNLNIPIIPSGPAEFVGTKVPIAYLCWFLGQQMQIDPRPVIDKTGLTQVYDFTLDFMPELPPGVSIDALPPEMQNRPTILDAVREQLGLRLESGRGPVENYLIDHVDKPSEN
jgi:uncharacterized protein (TIGR03435 family)